MAQIWIDLFPWLTYLLALVVLVRAWQTDGLFFALLPLIFFAYFLLSELAATQGALGYDYVALPHEVRIPLDWVQALGTLVFGAPFRVERPETCDEMEMAVPLAVPIFEAILVFSLVRTAWFLKAHWTLSPFMVGLAAVLLDAVLDPAAAHSEWCGDPSKVFPIQANGLEFWHWYVWGHFQPAFHGIPLVNFGAWLFGSAAIVIAAERVMAYFNIEPGQPVPFATVLAGIIVALLMVLIIGFTIEFAYFMWMHALFEVADAAGQWAFLIGAGLAIVYAIASAAGGFERSEENRWELWLVPLLLIVTNLVGMFASGPHAKLGWLVFVFLITTPAVLLMLWWPRRP